MLSRNPQLFSSYVWPWRVVVVLSLFIISSCASCPSDSKLIATFQTNRSDFEKVKVMAIEDAYVDRIAPGFVHYSSSPKGHPALNENRLNIYRALFRKLGVKDGIGISPNKVYFYIYDSGLSGSGTSKGITWSSEEPDRIVPNLDTLRNANAQPVLAWRRISGEWYLEYEAD